MPNKIPEFTMKKRTSPLQWALAASMLLLFTESAFAYLDPGTGSIILQGVIAGVALALSTVKLWWYRLTSLFTRQKEDSDLENNE